MPHGYQLQRAFSGDEHLVQHRAASAAFDSQPVKLPMSRILALDHGSKRIGVAISDEMKMIAQPVEFIPAEPIGQPFARLQAITVESRWDFKFLGKDGRQLGQVTKKWAGIGKELFTSADTYVISLDGPTNRTAPTLLLAAGLAVDIVLKER